MRKFDFSNWEQAADTDGTRPAEHAHELNRLEAEKQYQQAVAALRVTLNHDRAVIEADEAAQELDTELTEARQEFLQRDAAIEPVRLEYVSGFGETYPQRDRPAPEPMANPSLPGTMILPPDYHEPPGYGLYQDDAEDPWPNLVEPPDNNPSMMPAPTAPAPKPPLAWFQEGYEPEWDGRPVSSSSIYYTSRAQHDEYGDPYDDIGSTAASTLLSEQYLLRYDILSPVTVLERGHAQWEWEQVVTAAFPNQYWNSSVSYYVGGAFSAQVSEIYTLNHDDEPTNNITIPNPVGLHTLVYTATTPYVRFVAPPPPVSGSVGGNTNTGSGVTAQTTNPDEPGGGTGWGTPEETPPPTPPPAPTVPVSPASNKIDGGAEKTQANNGKTQRRIPSING